MRHLHEIFEHVKDDAGKVVLTFGVLQDITERKQAEEADRLSRQRLADAQRLAHLGSWEWNLATDDLFMSDEAFRIYGYEPQAFAATIDTCVQAMHPDDRGQAVEALDRAKTLGTPFSNEFRILRPDGTLRHVIERGEIMFGDDGTPEVMSGAVYDITERRQLEGQLRQSQKMEAVGQLTGGVAHDFNNLLAVILGNSELLQDRIGDDEMARHELDEIRRSVDRAASLTHRLLAFSRQQALSPVATNLDDMVRGLAEMLDRTLGETIDRHQFENVLVNLAINARDAMPAGGELTIETANTTLDATDVSQYEDVTPGEYVMIAVGDAGTGMPPEVLDKVFEPFFTTKDVGEGSGLGLSMVYGFVKQSGGHVKIYSEEGHGTTVKLFMPRSRETAVEEVANEETAEIQRGAERILVVEDNEGVLEISMNILREQGYEVVEARNGDEAVDRLRDDHPFDLLFTDIVLPGVRSGVEIAQEAKRLQPHIKVIYTTGYAENAVMHKGKLERGAVVVNKPYRRAELLEKVRNTLDSNTN